MASNFPGQPNPHSVERDDLVLGTVEADPVPDTQHPHDAVTTAAPSSRTARSVLNTPLHSR